jgi:hypothetical protein
MSFLKENDIALALASKTMNTNKNTKGYYDFYK